MAQATFSHTPRTKSGPGALLVVIGLLLALGPWFIPESVGIPGGGKIALLGIGLAFAFVGSILLVVTHLYKTATADLAFVRTGKGGPQPCLSGGMLIIPFWHEVIWVSLKTVAIPVDKMSGGSNTAKAIRTSEGIPVDLEGMFYVAVDNKPEAVLAAAKSLGSQASDPNSFKTLVEAKVDSALRTVTQGSSFDDLNTDRKKFTDKVQAIVNEQLEPNGLKLEDVALTTFNQAPFGAMDENNILDARARQIITETTAAASVKVNELTRNAEKLKKQKDVETRKEILAQEFNQTQAENDNQLEITKSTAETDRQKAVVQANAARDREIAIAEANKDEAIAKTEADRAMQEALTKQQQALKVLQEQAEQAKREAEIAKDQAISVAEQKKLQEIAKAKAELAQREAERLAKEEERVKAQQAVETAEAVAKAERDKQIAVTNQEAESKKRVLAENAAADVEAYKVRTIAEAKQQAAQNEATALTTAAEAKQKAAELEAKGEQAKAMVPVNVAKEQVEVEKKRVEVEGTRLEQQTKNAQVSVELEVRKATIHMHEVVGSEFAKALAAAFESADIQMWGTPEQVLSMGKAFTSGQSFGKLIDGASSAMPEEIRNNVVGGTSAILHAVAKLAKDKLGLEMTPEQAAELLKEHMPTTDSSSKS